MSFPFRGKTFTFTQPDGTPFSVVGFGDQHTAFFESPEGYTLTKDAKGFYCYANLSPTGELTPTALRPTERALLPSDLAKHLRPFRRLERGPAASSQGTRKGLRRCEQRWELRRKEALSLSPRSMRAPPTRGTVGDFTGLCLLVQFPDVLGTVPQTDVDEFCNGLNYTSFGNNGSVRQYFLDNSHGRFRYNNIVAAYYTAKYPREYYTDPKVTCGTRARALITEALQSLMAKGFDFSKLSSDSSGYVYAINAFYAGPCINNWNEGLWPHSWSLKQPLKLAPGRSAYDYQITNIGSELSIGVFCHENGHMVCDFPDLYDYGYESSGAGDYCLMSSGGPSEKNPVNVCAYLRYKAGWLGKVTQLKEGDALALPYDADEAFLYAKTQTEYFIIENRCAAKRDITLPSSGLAIWHVDEGGDNSNEQMSQALHYECSLEQADGKFHLETNPRASQAGDLFNSANTAGFNDTTTPNAHWWDGSPSGFAVRNIAIDSNQTIHCSIGKETPPIQQEPLGGESAPKVKIPDNNITGIVDTILLNGDPGNTVASVSVHVEIKHSQRGDLRVSLRSPAGQEIVLHNRSGGKADDLRTTFTATTTPALLDLKGSPAAGGWMLFVSDLAAKHLGTLEKWSIEVEVEPQNQSIGLAEEAGAIIPDHQPEGITRSISCPQQGRVGQVEVSVDITHSYVGDLAISLISPQGTHIVLQDQAGGSTDNLIKTFNVTNTPELDTLAGQSTQGVWMLKVADMVKQDEGKLARWALKIHRV